MIIKCVRFDVPYYYYLVCSNPLIYEIIIIIYVFSLAAGHVGHPRLLLLDRCLAKFLR